MLEGDCGRAEDDDQEEAVLGVRRPPLRSSTHSSSSPVMAPDAQAPDGMTGRVSDPFAHRRWKGHAAVPVCVTAEGPTPGME